MERIQLTFLRRALNLPLRTKAAAISVLTGIQPIEHRLATLKLRHFRNIQQRGPSSLTYKVLQARPPKKPGLRQELQLLANHHALDMYQ